MLVAKFPFHPYPQIGPLLRTSARPGPKDLITCRDHGRHGLVVEPDELRYFTKQKTTCPFLIISVGFTASSCHFCSCFQMLPSNNHFFLDKCHNNSTLWKVRPFWDSYLNPVFIIPVMSRRGVLRTYPDIIPLYIPTIQPSLMINHFFSCLTYVPIIISAHPLCCCPLFCISCILHQAGRLWESPSGSKVILAQCHRFLS
jgi:hypothetical protein